LLEQCEGDVKGKQTEGKERTIIRRKEEVKNKGSEGNG
jgi:hypothetical protein